MALLLDTNIAIHLRDADETIVGKLERRRDSLTISLATLIELEGGVQAKPELADYRQAGLDIVIARVTVLPLDRPVVTAYRDILRSVGFSRKRIPDRLIAATAIVHGFTLITINGEDFHDIPGLDLEVWPHPAAQ